MAKPNDRTRLGRFKKGASGNPSGIRKDSAGKPSRNRSDDWQNFFTGQGVFGKDKRVGTNFNIHTLSFDQLKDLWLGDDLAARSVETIPKEAMRQGYDIVISSAQNKGAAGAVKGMDPSELASEVTQKLDTLGADNYLEIAAGYERGYGGGAILIGANDGQADMTQPLNLAKVKEINWLTPLEARELMPLYAYADPRAPKYGQPEIYQLMSRAVLPSYSGNYSSATMLIHESRLIVFPGIRVSRYQVSNARGGWGESTLARTYRVLRDFNTAWGAAGVLVSDFAQSVIKIAGLWEALALDGEKAFQNRLAAMEYGRSTVNAVTIDAGDSYERQQTPLSGLPDLLEKFAVRLAAACDMPLTLLFGTSPAGMNATGESDIRFFYDRVAAYQNRKMVPALRQLCQVIFRTIGNKQEPDKWSVKFRPLWQDSSKDKAAAMLTQAQADVAWIGAGVLSPEEIASAHWGKGEYDPNISVDFEARESQEGAAAAPVSQADLNALDPNHYTYTPPPEPGTAGPGATVPPPGPPAAPDPNTPPKTTVQAEDSADSVRRDERDERARFAGKGYGMPSKAQTAAQASHERMAGEHATKCGEHAAKSRALMTKAEGHAAAGDWDAYQTSSRKAIEHQGKAASALAQVAYHAARAGTDAARAHTQRASAEMSRQDAARGDVWSDAAREAAAEARRENAGTTSAAERERRANYSSGRASKAKGVDRATAHGRAAAMHEIAAEHQTDPAKASEHMQKAREHSEAAEKLSNPGKRAPNEGMYAGAKPIEGAQTRTTETKASGEVIHANHGLSDLSGRMVGGRATITPTANGHQVELMPTRNGEKFGQYGHKTTTHPTVEAARAHANEALDKQREHFVKKSAEIASRARGDVWSEEAREAALEARKKGAEANAKAGIGTSKGAASARGAKKGAEPKAAAKAEPAKPKGPVASAPDRNHGPVPPPAGHEAPATDTKWHKEDPDSKHSGLTFGHEEIEHAHGAVHPTFGATQRESSGAKPESWRGEAHGKDLGKFASKNEAKAAVAAAHEAHVAKSGGEKAPAAHEGKHGGEHVPAHGEKGHGGKEHGKGKKGEGVLERLKGFAKGAGEVVGGEEASKMAEQLAPVGGEGEHEHEEE
jgi:phage-related protein (TIGR01555 family)